MCIAVTDLIWDNIVEVKGGIFRMEGEPEQGIDAGDYSERPVHSVKLDDFRICRYPVTQGEWQALMGHNPSHFRGDPNLPVEMVSWDDAESFIVHLNSITSGGYRLPTVPEWEYAALGGEKTRGYKYSGGNLVDEVAWTVNNSNKMTHPVGQLTPNELGLFDMSGNLWEWCKDLYREYDADTIRPKLSKLTSVHCREMRGGCWSNDPYAARVKSRSSYYPVNRPFDTIGFRLAFQG